MTTAPAFTPHPLDRDRLRPGDIRWVWCSKAQDRTDHLYQPDKTPPLLCLHCFPEQDPRKEGEE